MSRPCLPEIESLRRVVLSTPRFSSQASRAFLGPRRLSLMLRAGPDGCRRRLTTTSGEILIDLGWRGLPQSRGSLPVSVLLSGVRSCRIIAFAVAVLGSLAWSNHAQATGCHVAQRPTLGLEAPRPSRPTLLSPAKTSTSPDPAGYRQAPCPGETPSTSPRIVDPPPAILAGNESRIFRGVDDLTSEPQDVIWPTASSQRLDRPPRR